MEEGEGVVNDRKRKRDKGKNKEESTNKLVIEFEEMDCLYMVCCLIFSFTIIVDKIWSLVELEHKA